MSTENEMRILTIRETDFTVRDSRLDNVKLIKTVNNIAPDMNGNVNIEIGSGSGGSEAIIDVLELPTENINKNAIYRLKTARFIVKQGFVNNGSIVYCVNSLPESGEVVTDFDMSKFTAYYNTTDGIVYGYADETLAGAVGVPAGWYSFEQLGAISSAGFNGVFTDIEDSPMDNNAYGILLGYDYYIYQDGWCKVPLAYEKAPAFDIRWDGVVGDRFALDISALGYPNSFFVKITDRVFDNEELIGCMYTQSVNYEHIIDEYDFADMFPGMTSVDNGIVIVHDAESLNSALGTPSGYMTNGTYFALITDGNGGIVNYTDRLVAPTKIVKMGAKYIDISSENTDLKKVAFTGNYNDLNNKPDVYTDVIRYSNQYLGAQQKQLARNNIDVYSRSEVDTKISNGGGSADLTGYAKTTDVETMISNAIGSAIGGSY